MSNFLSVTFYTFCSCAQLKVVTCNYQTFSASALSSSEDNSRPLPLSVIERSSATVTIKKYNVKNKEIEFTTFFFAKHLKIHLQQCKVFENYFPDTFCIYSGAYRANFVSSKWKAKNQVGWMPIA